jgi:HAD superfamily hydrolase (TIGR01450 family)
LASCYFASRACPQERRVLVIGEPGLVEEVGASGVQVVEDPQRATDVLVGMDLYCTYRTICRGHRAVMRGAALIATNADATYPVESETIPGAGVLVRALEVSTGRRAVVLGKPHPAGIQMIMDVRGESDPENVAIVGDRLETDIAAGKAAGIRTVLVLSGIASREEAARLPLSRQPDVVLDSLRDVISLKLPVRVSAATGAWG